ncbi:DUF1045 domain-containing protein [Phaeovulum vinaykumarii]|uniref:Phosphonate metabolism protein n=1 Tax=Phaeovulum vinaykumarii TaxID=407234 RepID=A0A1N7LXT5_9RHOB|nr:DUF1045 domain-containing protein [Phaeovulum vinaykumarii]SIS78627.1 Protein of unknown function [Phaeovulum vinaykumarii]SOC06924.1 uncharacterized protein DUF1045 [Phaeovulum vinaykumarii]
MMHFRRYAIYAAPRPGALAEVAADWLGWDPATGAERCPPDLPGLPRPLRDLTRTPRRYGFHATLKAPFRLAPDLCADDLAEATSALACHLAPVEGLELSLDLMGGRFLALRPRGAGAADLIALGAEVVAGLDMFRAPATGDEIARRNPAALSPRQRDYLDRFGYPWVMEEFRPHLTLTGDLDPAEVEAVRHVAAAHFAPHLAQPFAVADLCLCAEDDAGRFHLLDRYPLRG